MEPVTDYAELLKRYTSGVDRSITELASAFLAEYPNGDPAEFLEAVGIDAAEAAAALELLELPAVVDPDAIPAKAAEVVAWIGEDRERAQRALEAEQTLAKPRETVLTAAAKVLEAQ